MYKRNVWTSRLRALLLAGLLTVSPAASAISREGGFSISEWLQRIVSSILTMTSLTEDDEQCTCGGGNPDCGALHIPGG